MKYRVGIKEVYEQMYNVDAESKEDAIIKLQKYLEDASFEEDVWLLEEQFEYCNSLPSSDWAVYEPQENEYV